MILVKNINDIIDEIRSGEIDTVYMCMCVVLFIVCGLGLFVNIRNVQKYEKAPKVLTTELPSTDSLDVDGKTYYLYKFQDNYYKNIKKE